MDFKFKVGDKVFMPRSAHMNYEPWVITEVLSTGYSHSKGFIPKQDEPLWELESPSDKQNLEMGCVQTVSV